MTRSQRSIIFVIFLLCLSRAQATLWFGITDPQEGPMIVGLSSGPISWNGSEGADYVGHIVGENTFIGIGSLTIPVEHVSEILKWDSASPQSLLEFLTVKFPDRRFILGTKSQISISQGLTGCNASNTFCGQAIYGEFSIIGVDSFVI